MSCLLNFTDVAEGNTEVAQRRLEDMACLNVAAIAALTHLPVTAITADAAKRKVLQSDLSYGNPFGVTISFLGSDTLDRRSTGALYIFHFVHFTCLF